MVAAGFQINLREHVIFSAREYRIMQNRPFSSFTRGIVSARTVGTAVPDKVIFQCAGIRNVLERQYCMVRFFHSAGTEQLGHARESFGRFGKYDSPARGPVDAVRKPAENISRFGILFAKVFLNYVPRTFGNDDDVVVLVKDRYIVLCRTHGLKLRKIFLTANEML